MLTDDGFLDADHIQKAYEAHVKTMVRCGLTPMNPDQWMDFCRDSEVLPDLDGKLPQQDSKQRKTKKQTDPATIKAKFTAMMLDDGITNDMSLYNRVRHQIELGNERPRNVKPTTPCVMCEDIFCAWAR